MTSPRSNPLLAAAPAQSLSPSTSSSPGNTASDPIFTGGGAVGALCREKDWSKTPLGPVETWPQSLKTAVSIVLTSSFPMIVLWGRELIQIYNDGYRLLMGQKHPGGLGQANRECWPEVWNINEPLFGRVFDGESVFFEERLYPLAPHGKIEDFYLTLTYHPVRDESGNVGGVIVTVFDVTAEVRTRMERDRAMIELRAEQERLREVFMQAPAAIAVLEGPEHRFTVANKMYLELVGGREVVGKSLAEGLPETIEQGFGDLLTSVRTSGKPFTASEMLVRLDRKGNGQLDDVYVDFVYQPLRDADGEVFGVLAHAVDTTEQVVARRKIESLAAERKAMLGQIADAVVTLDADGRITFINEVAKSIYPGLETGLTFAQQHGSVSLLRLDGSPYPAEEIPTARARRGERVLNEEWFVGSRTGQRRIQGSAVPVHDEKGALLGVVLTARDITREHDLKQQVELERNRLKEVFLQAPASVMVTRGPRHEIEVANSLYVEMVGNRPLVGKTLPEAFPDLVGQGLFELYDQVFATGEPYVGREAPVRVERFGRVDEAYFNFVYQPLIGADGKAFGTLTHAVEVTDMVRARQEAEKRAAELVRLTQALEASNRELDQFAYVASHDLKGPLRGIASLSQWLEEDLSSTLTGSAKEHLELLRGRVHRMEALIDGILSYSRAGRTRDPIAEIDSGVLIREAVEMLSPPSEVLLEIASGLPKVKAERVPLQQVFMNLIGNAIKFTAPSRPDPVVRVGFADQGSSFEFFVSDNGPGIAPEFQDRIWGIFQTLESRDKVEGTGIGLSVVKKIVETRGGRVWIESADGEGSTFRFTWPKRPVEY